MVSEYFSKEPQRASRKYLLLLHSKLFLIMMIRGWEHGTQCGRWSAQSSERLPCKIWENSQADPCDLACFQLGSVSELDHARGEVLYEVRLTCLPRHLRPGVPHWEWGHQAVSFGDVPQWQEAAEVRAKARPHSLGAWRARQLLWGPISGQNPHNLGQDRGAESLEASASRQQY